MKEGLLYTYLRHGVDWRTANPEVAIRTAHTPILLIHGLADDETYPRHSERLAKANPGCTELWLVPGAKHTGAYATDPRHFEARVLRWFRNAMAATYGVAQSSNNRCSHG